jgi:ABC-2 type transport system permease protein
MTTLIRGELIKAVTTRTVLGYALTGAALATANAVIVTQFSDSLNSVSDKQQAIAGLPILFLLLGLVGAAGEYRHKTAGPAVLAAGRNRAAVLLARAGAYAFTGLAVGALMAAVALGLGLPLLAGLSGPGLGAEDVALVAGGSLIAAAVSAILGVAIGALVRNQVAGVIGTLTLAFVVGPLVTAIDEDAFEFTPFGSAFVLAGNSRPGGLSVGAAALVLAAWTAPMLIAAMVVERRRDLA